MIANYREAVDDILRGIQYYDMSGLIGWLEIKRRYRRTVIGPFWTSLSLSVFVIALGIVWSQLWKQDPKVYLPYLCSGLICWVLFSSFVSEGCSVFVAAESLIKQMRWSYMMFVLALVWRNLIVFGHNFLIYVAICFYGDVPLNWYWLLAIPGLLVMCINGMWITLILGMFCARYRDVQQVVTSLLQVAMFVTPIMWPSNQLSGSAHYLVDYNLLYHYIEIVRDPLMGQPPSAWSWLMVGLSTVLGWALALALFARFRRRIPYWL